MATRQIARPYTTSHDAVRYPSMREELRELKVGDVFKATFLGKYGATCGRRALGHFCRSRLGFEIETHQDKNVIVIKRNR